MSLLNTYLLEIRAEIPNPVERDEWRFTRYGLLEATKEMTESPMSIINQDLKDKALMSEGTALKVPVYSIGDITVSNTRSCTIGDLENTTNLVDVTWVTLSADISMIKAQYMKNEVSYLQDLNKKLQLVDNGFAKAVEQLIYTKLDTEKSIVYNSPLVGGAGTYPLVGNTLQVALAQQEYFFNDLEAIMEGDDFYTAPFKVLGNTTLRPPVRHYMNQGSGNDENLNYQFGPYDFRFSNHLVNGAGIKATGFCMTDGSIGILTRVNADALQMNKAGDGTEWETATLPTFGFPLGVMYKSACDDVSSITGLEHLTATMVEKWQFSVDVALLTPYNSDTANNPGVIKKFEFLTA